MMNNHVIAASIAVGAILGLAGTQAQADSPSPGDERFNVMVGWFLPAFDTDVRIDGEVGDGVGDDVNLGDDLGIDNDQSALLAGFEWRFADRHRLGTSWSTFSQSGTRVFDEELTIGDEVFPVDAEVRSEWSIDLIPITYSYSFLKRENYELAGTFGIHWDKFSLRLRSETSVTGEVLDLESDSSADLPLPLLGLRYDYHFSDNWSAGLSASYFSIEFGDSELDAKGSLSSLRAYGEYRFLGRWGVGIGVDVFNLDIEADKSNLQGEYNYDYWGPQIYLKARF
jgi:hypothetical protein